ncbi:MAG TPA: hypothetical protein VF679_06695 [Pedobacter sp.]|jgi:hypothetical protein
MVNHNNIFKKIGYILNELQDQYQFLSDNPNQLSELELELFLANAKFLAEHVQIVMKLTINQPLKELSEVASTQEDEDVIVGSVTFQENITPPPYKQEKPAEEQNKEATSYVDAPPTFEFVLNDRSPEEALDLEEVVQDNHREEQVDIDNQEAEDVEEYDNEVTYVQPSVEELGPEPFLIYNEVKHQEPLPDKVEPVFKTPQPEPIKHPEPTVHHQQPAALLREDDLKAQEIPKPTHTFVPDNVEDKVVQPSAATARPTLNDLLAANQRPNVNKEASSQPVTDLKKSVNLNEKLLYIKDLFNGYNLAYSEAIDIINKLPDFKSADAFLKHNYAIKNNWQAKQATVDKFYGLLRQRFPEA